METTRMGCIGLYRVLSAHSIGSYRVLILVLLFCNVLDTVSTVAAYSGTNHTVIT